MPYYRTTYYCGDVYEVEEYYSPRIRGKRIPRGKNQHLSSEQQMELNLRNARKKLSRTINTNFGKGDVFVTLTYAEEPTEGVARREMTNFLRRVKRYRQKEGMSPLKYVAVTEMSDHRIHHHMILNAISADAVFSQWKKGRAIISKLEPGGDYTGLANYITKEASLYGRGKRWSQSRNLKKPKIRVRMIKKEKLTPLNPPRGYKVIQQQFYVSEATGQVQYLRAIRIGGADYSESTRSDDLL